MIEAIFGSMMIILLMMITLVIWGVVQIVKINRESKELERQIDEWYERDMAWLEKMMKDENDE